MTEQSTAPNICVLVASRDGEFGGSPSLAPDLDDRFAIVSPSDSDHVFDGLRSAGYTHCITVPYEVERWHELLTTLERAIADAPDKLILCAYEQDQASRLTRLGVRSTTGFKLREPDAIERAYPLDALEDLALPTFDDSFHRDVLLVVSRGGVRATEISLSGLRPQSQSIQRPPFSFVRMHRAVVATMTPWFLPPAYLELTARRSYRELPFRARVREGLHELLLREPGSNARVGASAGFGFFMGLIPLWGYQILLTVLLSHRLGFSKTVSLVCAQISLPPVIPFIMYGSLVLGRTLLGVEEGQSAATVDLAPVDFWPWFLGSWVLALGVGIGGGFCVWVLVSLLRRSGKTNVQSAP